MFTTPIYAIEEPPYEVMPLYENVSKVNVSFVINTAGLSVASLDFNLKNNTQSIRIETKIQKRL